MNRRELIKGGAFAGLITLLPSGDALISDKATHRTSKIEMFSIAGQTVFPIYGYSGGISSEVGVYPMYREGDATVLFGYRESAVPFQGRMESMEEEVTSRAKKAFIDCLNQRPEIEDVLEGTWLPTHGQVLRFWPRRA